jgi:hypothetical protein
MVLARVADIFTTGGPANQLVDDGHASNGATTMHKVESVVAGAVGAAVDENIDEDAARPPYLHVRALHNPHGRHVN